MICVQLLWLILIQLKCSFCKRLLIIPFPGNSKCYLGFVCLCACVCLLQAGMGGHYVLDEYGDRDANFSMIYTSTLTSKVRLLCIQQLPQTEFEPNIFCFALKSQRKGEHSFLIFASVSAQYETLFVFDTSKNKTIQKDTNPDLHWKGRHLPNDKPEVLNGSTHTYTDGVQMEVSPEKCW